MLDGKVAEALQKVGEWPEFVAEINQMNELPPEPKPQESYRASQHGNVWILEADKAEEEESARKMFKPKSKRTRNTQRPNFLINSVDLGQSALREHLTSSDRTRGSIDSSKPGSALLNYNLSPQIQKMVFLTNRQKQQRG